MFGLLSEEEIEDEMKFFVKRWRKYGPKDFEPAEILEYQFEEGKAYGISVVLTDLEKVFGIFEKEPKI